LSLADKDTYPEPNLVEEVFEDGCPSLSRRFARYLILIRDALQLANNYTINLSFPINKCTIISGALFQYWF
jgi:hypothetical protein